MNSSTKPDLSAKAAEIVDHARSLLVTGGYKSFSYADISARVNIRKASIHHHFPSKAALVETVVALYRDEARQGMARLEQQIVAPLARIRGYIDYWSNCIGDAKTAFCICAMLAYEMPTLPSEVAAQVRLHFEELSGWLEQQLQLAHSEGQLTLVLPAAAEAKSLMACVHGAMLAARALDDSAVFDGLMQVALARLTASA